MPKIVRSKTPRAQCDQIGRSFNVLGSNFSKKMPKMLVNILADLKKVTLLLLGNFCKNWDYFSFQHLVTLLWLFTQQTSSSKCIFSAATTKEFHLNAEKLKICQTRVKRESKSKAVSVEVHFV